jgi:hypothetical protein
MVGVGFPAASAEHQPSVLSIYQMFTLDNSSHKPTHINPVIITNVAGGLAERKDPQRPSKDCPASVLSPSDSTSTFKGEPEENFFSYRGHCIMMPSLRCPSDGIELGALGNQKKEEKQEIHGRQ